MLSGTPDSGSTSSAVERLVPCPRQVAERGAPIVFDEVVIETGPECAAAVAPIEELRARPGRGGVPATVRVGWKPDCPFEGYRLTVSGSDDAPVITISGSGHAGMYYGVQTLLSLAGSVAGRWWLPRVDISDWPELPWRGTIEGFYGPPWSHEDRLAHLRFAGRHKLNTYVYAPKDDPFHRARWRDPYPDTELERLRELVEVAAEAHVRFVFTISPGLSMVYSDPAELDLLLAKLEQVWAVGVRDFGLLFDDIEPDLAHDADVEAFGAQAGASGRAHAFVCRQVMERFLTPRRADRPLLMVPTDYAGMDRSAYRDLLGSELPGDVLVWWTGRDIVVGDVKREHIDAAAESYCHRLLLWDNFPVNDFDFSRLFLGPLVGRTTEIDAAKLAGITANPMPQAAASEIALATVADWAWNPGGYDPDLTHRRVRAALGGGAAVDALIDSCSAWPPSAPQHPELSALLEDVLTGDAAAAERARSIFRTMTRPAEPATPRAERLVRELQPWLDAQAAMGRAGLAALGHLTTRTAATRAAAEKALAEVRACEQNVLRSVVPLFVERVLAASPSSPPSS